MIQFCAGYLPQAKPQWSVTINLNWWNDTKVCMSSIDMSKALKKVAGSYL